MGASGCGKTSLMNVLSGRATSMGGHVVTANISVNGKVVSPSELGPKVAYVMQEDSLTATATPREAFDFSARLRLPPSVTAAERTQMVNEMISILHLEKCADTMIGNELIKGISGGEKKVCPLGPRTHVHTLNTHFLTCSHAKDRTCARETSVVQTHVSCDKSCHIM